MNEVMLPIASVERETGLSKDTLRVWERRYGFPVPERDTNHERLYPGAQVRKLVLLKRLIDCGHRPGKLLRLDETALSALDAPRASILSTANPETLDAWMGWVVRHETAAFGRHFHRELLRLGMEVFLTDIVAPLVHRVGAAWARGEIGIAEEHLVSQQVAKHLREALASAQPELGTPRCLLTTLPGEEHTLGLLMVESMLVTCGAATIQLGAQTPLTEIVRASAMHKVEVVCLSFSSAFPAGQLSRGISDLRQALPHECALWAGGAAVRSLRKPPDGVRLLPELSDIPVALGELRRGEVVS